MLPHNKAPRTSWLLQSTTDHIPGFGGLGIWAGLHLGFLGVILLAGDLGWRFLVRSITCLALVGVVEAGVSWACCLEHLVVMSPMCRAQGLERMS